MGRRSDDSLRELPEVRDAPFGTREKLATLINRAHDLRESEKQLKAIKKQIADMIYDKGLMCGNTFGVRNGILCAIVSESAGRETFDPEKAIEIGFTPKQIQACMKRGKSFTKVELCEIGKADADTDEIEAA